jgi:hypothetical protein
MDTDLQPLAHHHFGMYSDSGRDAVRSLIASVLLLALEEETTAQHVAAALRLGLAEIGRQGQYEEALDSAVRDEVDDYLCQTWGLISNGWVFGFPGFAGRRRVLVPALVTAAPRDAHQQLIARDLAAAATRAAQTFEGCLEPAVKNAFRRLAAGEVNGAHDDEGRAAVRLRNAGAYAELSFAGRPCRLRWEEMLALFASLEAGCGAEALAARALALPGA